MSWRGWVSALAGVIAGAVLVGVMPAHQLFKPAEFMQSDQATGERWACPMMDFIGSKPGVCPVCGMHLERVTAGEVTREQSRRMGIATTKVITGPAAVVVHAYGAAEYDDRFSQTVIARVSGRIVKRHPATFGCCAEVAVGDPIIDLYSPEVFQAQGELVAAVKGGQQDLAKAITERFSRWNLGHVAADIIAGKAPTDIIAIVSPVAGQAWLADQEMVNQTLMVGSQVTADMPLLKLVNTQRLTLVVHVPEPRAHFIREGQAVHLSSDDMGELPDVQAIIGRVSNEINPKIRAREVRIFLTDGRRKLLPGSLVRARFQGVLAADLSPANPADSSTWGQFPLVPKSAILTTGVRSVAWRVSTRKPDGTVLFAPVSVALGPRIEDADGHDVFIVRAGLVAGDEVATQGLFLIDAQAQLAGSPSLLFPDGAGVIAVPPLVSSASVPSSVPSSALSSEHQH